MGTYSDERLANLLPYPSKDANKYSRGKLVLVVGSAAYPGAAMLASAAGQRAGAGYCEVFTHPGNMVLLQLSRPSLVVRNWNSLAQDRSPQPFTVERPVAYVVGSGFDVNDDEAKDRLLKVLRAKAPVLIDGGALGMLAAEEAMEILQLRGEKGFSTVLTPHIGEAAVLAAACGVDVNGDAESFAADLAEALGSVVCLKGPVTYIAAPNGQVECMDEGTAALAKAGTGDVLAGIIGAFLTQGMGDVDAAMLGATAHARAGRLAAEVHTEISVCPEDVLEFLPAAFKSF